MSIKKILGFGQKYFTSRDAARALKIPLASAQVACSRYAKDGILIRPKRDLYILKQAWDNLAEDQAYALANLLQTPSYISLTTALAAYDATTQVQRDFFESVSLKRTKEISIAGKDFMFRKVSGKLYGGFVRRNGYFIATPEKALADALYLTSLGRYRLDLSALDTSRMDARKLEKWFSAYPPGAKELWRAYVGSLAS